MYLWTRRLWWMRRPRLHLPDSFLYRLFKRQSLPDLLQLQSAARWWQRKFHQHPRSNRFPNPYWLKLKGLLLRTVVHSARSCLIPFVSSCLRGNTNHDSKGHILYAIYMGASNIVFEDLFGIKNNKPPRHKVTKFFLAPCLFNGGLLTGWKACPTTVCRPPSIV
jgi:hypothetical protein